MLKILRRNVAYSGNPLHIFVGLYPNYHASFYARKIGFTKFSHCARHSSAATSWDLDETLEDDMCVLKLAQEKRSEDTIPH